MIYLLERMIFPWGTSKRYVCFGGCPGSEFTPPENRFPVSSCLNPRMWMLYPWVSDTHSSKDLMLLWFLLADYSFKRAFQDGETPVVTMVLSILSHGKPHHPWVCFHVFPLWKWPQDQARSYPPTRSSASSKSCWLHQPGGGTIMWGLRRHCPGRFGGTPPARHGGTPSSHRMVFLSENPKRKLWMMTRATLMTWETSIC